MFLTKLRRHSWYIQHKSVGCKKQKQTNVDKNLPFFKREIWKPYTWHRFQNIERWIQCCLDLEMITANTCHKIYLTESNLKFLIFFFTVSSLSLTNLLRGHSMKCISLAELNSFLSYNLQSIWLILMVNHPVMTNYMRVRSVTLQKTSRGSCKHSSAYQKTLTRYICTCIFSNICTRSEVSYVLLILSECSYNRLPYF